MTFLDGVPGDQGLSHAERGLVEHILKLPHRILRNHTIDGLAQIVLHEIGHKNSFDLKRATYLVDNPDFDHLIGVAGFCCDECNHHPEDMWGSPHEFKSGMSKAHFHNEIESFLKNSIRKKDIDMHNIQDVQELGHALGMTNPAFFEWEMKHGNHGYLIYENNRMLDLWQQALLNNCAALLSLCPIR